MTPSVCLRCATPHLLSLGGANLFTHQRFPNFAGGVTSMGGERSRPRLTGVGGGAGGARFARQLRPDGWPAADYDQSAPSIPPTPQPAHGRLRADPLNEDLAVHTTSEPSPLRSVSGAETLRLAVVVGALGVVFGDIGTSPIYTIQTVFNPNDPHPVPISADNVYGVVSLIFWSVMIIVTLTYVTLVMRADNDGEGGIMALITLLRRWRRRPPAHRHGVDHAGPLRRRAVLRRQHDHPRDLGAVRGRGHQGHRAGVGKLDRADHRGDHRRAVRRAAPRHGRRWASVRAGDDRVVRIDRRLRCEWHHRPSGNPQGARRCMR